jgi:hypothetical protein
MKNSNIPAKKTKYHMEKTSLAIAKETNRTHY